MKDALEKLMRDFDTFLEESVAFTDKSKVTTVEELRDMIIALPGFTETRKEYALHIEVAEKCMRAFKRKELLDLGLIEQVSYH